MDCLDYSRKITIRMYCLEYYFNITFIDCCCLWFTQPRTVPGRGVSGTVPVRGQQGTVHVGCQLGVHFVRGLLGTVPCPWSVKYSPRPWSVRHSPQPWPVRNSPCPWSVRYRMNSFYVKMYVSIRSLYFNMRNIIITNKNQNGNGVSEYKNTRIVQTCIYSDVFL